MSENKEGMEVQRRKVFISFLGFSNYSECYYYNDKYESLELNRFVQIPTLEYLTSQEQWTENDVAYFLLTKESKGNWIDDGLKDREGNIIYQKGLKNLLDNHHFPFQIRTIEDLPHGNNEAEIWTIFEKIYEIIDNNDQIYCDLTHGFRYYSMLILVLSTYAKFLKNIDIVHLSYGNYEGRDRKSNKALLVDLKPLSILQDWTFAAGQYIKSGNIEELHKLSFDDVRKIKAITRNTNESVNKLNNFINIFKQFIEHIFTCRGLSIKASKEFSKLSSILKTLDKSFIRVYNPILKKIRNDLLLFEENDDIKNCLAAADWCHNKGLYQQTATFLQEYLISYFCIKYNQDLVNKDVREMVNQSVRAKFLINSGKEYIGELSDFSHILLNDPLFQEWEFIKTYYYLNELRNDYNHSGFRKNPRKPDAIKDNLKTYIDTIKSIIGEEGKNETRKNKSIFINFSNHLSEKWDEKQKEEARSYGDIIDLKFPDIDETGDDFYISELVNKYTTQINSLTNNSPRTTTIHIMGEMTFTYAMVNALTELGYTCVASTTKRIVEDLPDGTKKTTFAFARFREYK